jgi:hypothetical protein
MKTREQTDIMLNENFTTAFGNICIGGMFEDTLNK